MINLLACRLILSGPNLTVVSIGMEYLSLVTLLLVYLNRFRWEATILKVVKYSLIRRAKRSYYIEVKMFSVIFIAFLV